MVSERHARRRASFDGALELPVMADGEVATLRAARDGQPFGEYDKLVLHHGQTALAFELSRRRAVSAAELRLAGDLLEDLEGERLDERETSRRMAAFGLEPARSYAALLAAPRNGLSGEQVRREVAGELDRRRVRYLSTARPRPRHVPRRGGERGRDPRPRGDDRGRPGRTHALGVGRPAHGRALGRSLLEARAALDAATGDVASYRDLGSLELLLSLPGRDVGGVRRPGARPGRGQ